MENEYKKDKLEIIVDRVMISCLLLKFILIIYMVQK